MAKYLCPPCGYVYDEEQGDDMTGIKPGTKFSELPNDWLCPACGAQKHQFVPLEEALA
jgi:rubredoxin